MKKSVSIIVLFICISGRCYGLDGHILKDQIFKSDTLHQEVKYNIYLPPNYIQFKTYPVLFYLHWFGGDHNSANEFMRDIDVLIANEKFPEIVIIAPNASRSWYSNDFKGKYRYSSMFIFELLPHIKNKYSISVERGKRAVAGSSMGGFAALRFAMLYPEEFGICISFMAAMSTREQIVNDNDADYSVYHQDLYGDDLKGLDRANEFFVANNPLYIAQQVNPEILKNTQWYIQTCDDDYHSLPNAELHGVFHRAGVIHEYRVYDGSHDNDCVRNGMDDALKFLKRSLQSE